MASLTQDLRARIGSSPEPLDYSLAPDGPVPGLTRQILELLHAARGDCVIDLCWHEGLSPPATEAEVRKGNEMSSPSPFGERVARDLAITGVSVVQMDPLLFGEVPMRYDKVLLRGGFQQFRSSPRDLLARLFARLDPAARLLVLDCAPSRDAPLFAEALYRWERQHCLPDGVAALVREAGFSADVSAVECARNARATECLSWAETRAWPILEAFSRAELRQGVDELRDRWGLRQSVEFTSRFELVLGRKPTPGAWRGDA